MKQSVPWSVKGVEADARETAKELARRSGMTLGQWLNAMIADQEAQDSDAPLPPERLADRLDHLNRRASATAAPHLAGGDADTAGMIDALMRRSAEAEARTTRMIEGLARASQAIESKTANALASVAKWIEAAERAPKQAETTKADALSKTAAELERRLSEMAEQLETRARPRATTAASAAPAVTAAPAQEAAAPRRAVASGAIEPPAGRSADLLEAVDQIGARQRLLDTFGDAAPVPVWPPRPRGSSEPPDRRARNEVEVQIANLTREVAALRQAGTTQPAVDTTALESRLDALGERIETLRLSGGNEAAIRSVEAHVAEMVKAIGDGTHRELSSIAAELKSITAKLDQIARDRPQAGPSPAAFTDALKALRADMAALTATVQVGPSRAIAALEARIDEIGERITELRDGGAGKAALQQVERHLAELVATVAELGSSPRADEFIADLRTVEAKLDRLAAQGLDPAALQRLAARTEAVHELLASQHQPDRMAALAGRIDALAEQVEGVGVALEEARSGPSNASLEAMIRSLADRLEAAQRPDADDGSLAALERQMARIAERLDAAETAAPDLTSIERTLSDLFGQLERTREDAIDAADGAVARAVREAMAQKPDSEETADVRQTLADIQASHDQAGRRTQLTLDAVHVTLERLADRMSRFETDLDTSRFAGADSFGVLTSSDFAAAASSPPQAPVEQPAPIAAPSPAPARPAQSFEPPAAAQIFEQPPAPPRMPRATPLVTELDLGGEVPLEPGIAPPRRDAQSAEHAAGRAMLQAASSDKRASFIAAARRAVLAAANEAGQAAEAAPLQAGGARIEPDLGSPSPAAAEPSAPAGPGRARSFYDRRKRPILLGLAAITLIIGTIQIAKLASPEPQPEPVAVPSATKAPAADASTAKPEPTIPSDPAAAPPAGSIEAPKPQSDLLMPSGAAPAIEPPRQTAEAPAARPPVDPGVPSLSASLAAQAAASVSLPGGTVAGAEPAEPMLDIPAKLSDAARAGEPRALYDMASRLADGRNPTRDLATAATLYQRAADKGFAPAQYRLGSMYEKGVGVTRDMAKARSLYESAADKGNVKAMHNMAVLYAEGALTGKADYASAAQWFHLAAEHGLRDSEYNYAILVARGLGPAPDLAEAYKWFALAAAQGDADAGAKRDEVAQRLDAAALAKAKTAVAGFTPKDSPVTANDSTLPAVSWGERTQSGA